jgi:2-polyprenyl-6-methoxyphenol hydroxylase-like FAD-dependent oxidoreductase
MAGMLDTDGHLSIHNHAFQFSQTSSGHSQLFNDFRQLAESLPGIRVSSTQEVVRHATDHGNTTFRDSEETHVQLCCMVMGDGIKSISLNLYQLVYPESKPSCTWIRTNITIQTPLPSQLRWSNQMQDFQQLPSNWRRVTMFFMPIVLASPYDAGMKTRSFFTEIEL